jgi:hypothetical protein
MTLYDGPGAVDVGRKRRRRLPNATVLEPIIEAPEESMQARSLVWGRAGADIGFVSVTFLHAVIRRLSFCYS